MLGERNGGRGDEKMQGLYLRIPSLNRQFWPRISQVLGRHKPVAMTTKEDVANLLPRLPRVCIHPPTMISTRTEFCSLIAVPQHSAGCRHHQAMTMRSGEWLLDQQHGSLAWGACSLILGSEFNPWNPHGRN